MGLHGLRDPFEEETLGDFFSLENTKPDGTFYKTLWPWRKKKGKEERVGILRQKVFKLFIKLLLRRFFQFQYQDAQTFLISRLIFLFRGVWFFLLTISFCTNEIFWVDFEKPFHCSNSDAMREFSVHVCVKISNMVW